MRVCRVHVFILHIYSLDVCKCAMYGLNCAGPILGITIGIVTKVQTQSRLKKVESDEGGQRSNEQIDQLKEELRKARSLIWDSLKSEFVG